MQASANLLTIVYSPDHSEQVPCHENQTGSHIFAEDPAVVVMRVDGTLVDLETPVAAGAAVEPVRVDSPEGMHVLRHSSAHVLAQAVQRLYPETTLGIGPAIKDGFYYDFDVAEPFSPEDLKKLEKTMLAIIKAGQRFVRVPVTAEQARAALVSEPYKLELIESALDAEHGAIADGAQQEVGAGALTLYQNVTRDGTVVWQDLCRGPHLPSTKLIGNGFALLSAAGAYWRGSEKNPQLQRIYGTVWPSKAELKEHLERLEEANRRDHRRLGAELDLFSFPPELGSGLPVFHPKGGVIKRVMEDYVRQRHIDSGFQYVGTPHIAKEELFYTSGHLPYYAESMFPAFRVEAEHGSGPGTREGQAYRLKAMNCPIHNLIYRSRDRSYRELPLRFFEFGHVYRHEKSGVVHGLTRVRGFAQDDSHSYVTPQGAQAEIEHLLSFVLSLLRDFGLNDFYLELSTPDEQSDKFIGSAQQWENAIGVLRQACTQTGLELILDPGGAAYYGPKVSVQARDAIGRSWQMSTIQYDFNLPERFDLEYQTAEGSRERPVLIHAAKFGSIERFFGVLTEHYAGAFPLWLAPVQVRGIPVAPAFEEKVAEVIDTLGRSGLRAEVDGSSDRFPKKIRTASKEKIPVVLIVGGDDVERHTVSFRLRNNTQVNALPSQGALDLLTQAAREHWDDAQLVHAAQTLQQLG